MGGVASATDITVGLIGCGAVADQYHLPALQRLLPPERVWLADTDHRRASLLAVKLGLPGNVVRDPRDLIGVIDAAIVAVPNDVHAAVASELLASGIHVLCEKPLSATVEGGERIVAAASGATVLRVGNVRRFFPSTRLLQHVLRTRQYGEPLRFVAEDGVPFEWGSASGFFLDRHRAGGGVLMDAGAHVLDQLLFWFGPDLEIVSYEDNAFAGVESDCRIEIAAGSVVGTVELSRLRRLRNTIRVECDGGTIESPLSELSDRLALTSNEPGGYAFEAAVPDESIEAHLAEVSDFLAAITGRPGTGATGEEALGVLRLIRECYARRAPLDEPWVSRPLRRRPAAPLGSTYKKILVTGASGFLGCRLSEHLRLAHGASVRAMIHRPERAMRLARLDVELVPGDLADPTSIERAVAGCDAVVHCAIGSDDDPGAYRFLTGKAAGTVAQAALRSGVKRFVHLSSVAVHGYTPVEPEVDEETPLRFTGDAYADAKIEAEAELDAALERGLPAVILRPTNIFGPYSAIFTEAPIAALKRGHVALAGDGAGPANTVYVDNVVHAITLALQSEHAVGERFVVSDDDGTTWRRLYEAYARLISPSCRVRSAPFAELYPEPEARAPEVHSPPADVARNGRSSPARNLRRVAVEQPVVRALGRVVLSPFPHAKDRLFDWLIAPPPSSPPPTVAPAPEPAPPLRFAPDEIPSKGFAEIQSSGVLFRAGKAREILGFEPDVRFDLAIELTGQWLRFTRLV
jgi:predicted dehydrogenase/nucleoside-diphosphate-sugar epimerase